MSKRRVLRTAAVILCVVVLLLTMAWLFQRKLIYHPDTSDPVAPSYAAEVTFPTEDGLRLAGWLFEPVGNDRDAVVLMANGNGGNRANRAATARALAQRGFTVLVFDYRGYGGNEGSPNETGLYADAEAAYQYLTGRPRFGTDRILFFGESLGTGVVSQLAVDHPPAAMVLRSPFTSLPDLGQWRYPYLPVRALLSETYPVEDNVAKTKVPLVVAYGTADSHVPAEQSKRVADAARDAGAQVRTVAVEGADHNDPKLGYGDAVMDAVAELADDLGATAD